MSPSIRCRRCGRVAEELEQKCRDCGALLRNPRFCPYCGKLKHVLLDWCDECGNAYQEPAPSNPLPRTQPPREKHNAYCPQCGEGRALNDLGCPHCGCSAPPLFPEK